MPLFTIPAVRESLEFSIQILMQSRKMESAAIWTSLKASRKTDQWAFARPDIGVYRIISRLIENASIMNKNFYVIVPLDESIFPRRRIFQQNIRRGKAKAVNSV